MHADTRGLSSIVGYILLTITIVAVAGTLFSFGIGYITEQTADKEDTNFRIDITDTDEIELVYDDGSTFDSTDTDQLDVIVEHDDDTSQQTIYEDGMIQSEHANGYELSPSTTVLKEELDEDNLFDYGTIVYIVWHPNDIDEYSVIIDTSFVPEEDMITIPRDSGGSFEGGGEIIIE